MNRLAQKGASLTIVLVMLTVLLLGALSMYKFNEANSLIAGNVAFKDAAQQASEVGISEAFAALPSIADEEKNQGNWYYATIQGDDQAGLPGSVDWSQTTSVKVGNFDVHYVVERQCTGATPVLDVKSHCVIKPGTGIVSAKAGLEALEATAAKLYRITVFVSGPKNTKSFVQSMVVR
jgi:Tfp pilus assembly protein PilX